MGTFQREDENYVSDYHEDPNFLDFDNFFLISPKNNQPVTNAEANIYQSNDHHHHQQNSLNNGKNDRNVPHVDTRGEQLYQIFEAQTMNPVPNPQSKSQHPSQPQIQPTATYTHDRSQNRHLTQIQNIHFDQMDRDDDEEDGNDNARMPMNTNQASTPKSSSSRSRTSTIPQSQNRSSTATSSTSSGGVCQDSKNLSTLNEKRDAALLKLLSVFDSHQNEYVTCLENEMLSLKEKLNQLSFSYINLRYENDQLRQHIQHLYYSFPSNPPN